MNNKVLAPTTADFRQLPGYPSRRRMEKGMVAVIECEQEIPCNPCETACPRKAITVGEPITNLPVLHEDLCVGCGLCVAGCPGQAIFMIDLVYGEETALVGFPYEYLPLPEKGEKVALVNRDGVVVGRGEVQQVRGGQETDQTQVVYVTAPREIAEEVRSIVRK